MIKENFKRRVYICQNKSEEIRLDSTSGGVFTAISGYVLDRGGVVFGATFDKDFRIIHKETNSYEGLSQFRGSKYVQSRLGKTFKKVENYLKDDKWVCFSGTPCQIEGLKSYLKKDYSKLVLMDIVCYAISSPLVWKQYLAHLERNNILKINDVASIKFRDKSKYGYEYTMLTFYDKNGNKLYASGPESNQMIRSFVSNTSTRPSCYHCNFKKVNRVSDFTVWDCYNVYQYDKSIDDNKGTSHLLIQSEKGSKIFSEIKKSLNVMEINIDKAIASEPAITESASPSKIRKKFFDAVSIGNAFDQYFRDTTRVKLERMARNMLSMAGIYSKIKRLIKQ